VNLFPEYREFHNKKSLKLQFLYIGHLNRTSNIPRNYSLFKEDSAVEFESAVRNKRIRKSLFGQV